MVIVLCPKLWERGIVAFAWTRLLLSKEFSCGMICVQSVLCAQYKMKTFVLSSLCSLLKTLASLAPQSCLTVMIIVSCSNTQQAGPCRHCLYASVDVFLSVCLDLWTYLGKFVI